MPARAQSSVFVSHSSANAAAAKRVGEALEAARFDVWLDSSDIRLGVLLRNELHQAIAKSRAVALLWSEPASKSRWVAAEILTAFHMQHRDTPSSLRLCRIPAASQKRTDHLLSGAVKSCTPYTVPAPS